MSRRQEKQDARAIKQMEDIVSGRVKVADDEHAKRTAQPNRKGGAARTSEEEYLMVQHYARFLRMILPGIVAKLSQIEDPRDQNRIEHSLPLLMLFGVVMFLSHCASRRAANRELAKSSLLAMMEEFVPGIAEMPHADTLARLLSVVDVESIDRHYEEMVKAFIRSKQFRERNPGHFIVAVDGTQKFSRRYQWDERALSRHAGDEEKEQYYVYVLESVLVLENGMVLPLLTEILENPRKAGGDREQGAAAGETDHREQSAKQDCETKAFHRLAKRLAKFLGTGCVTIVLDGIYASGPVISCCRNNGWDYMIVLKKDSLKTVWEDFNGLRKIETNNTRHVQWGGRRQEYQWSNGIEYIYGNNHKRLSLNVVTCTETWTERCPRSGGKPKEMATEYAWLSSATLTQENVFSLCTKIARSRWRIENTFLMEKHQGYRYEHCYSYNWEAMKGFHYLMKIGVFLNAFAAYSELVGEYVRMESIRGFVKRLWGMLTQGRWPAREKTENAGDAVVDRRRMRLPRLRDVA